MKTYTDIAKTGMWFHMFIHLFCIPISLLIIITNLLMLRGSNENLVFYYSFIYYCASIILLVLCFIGFWKLQKFSYYCIMIYCGLSLLDLCILLIGIYLIDYNSGIEMFGSNILINLVKTIILFTYYYKRRKLFTFEGINNPYKITRVYDNLIENTPKTETLNDEIPITSTKNYENTKKNKLFKNKFLILSILVIAVSVAGNIYLYSNNIKLNNNINELNNNIIDLNKSVDNWKSDYYSIKNETSNAVNFYIRYNYTVDFYTNHACVVSTTGEKYHTCDCKYTNNFDSFYIFNIEYAESLGYTPCSVCNPPKSK